MDNGSVDLLCEESRLAFVLARDGHDAAVAFARQLITIYLATTRAYKKKPGGKKHPYRQGYVESAMSARYILRHGFLSGEA